MKLSHCQKPFQKNSGGLMRQIGLSIYPEHADIGAIKAYIKRASELGYTRIFTCLISGGGSQDTVRNTFGIWTQYANALGFEVIADVSPDVFRALNLDVTDLKFFHELGLNGIRLDLGFSGQEESQMSFNSYGISIELNISNGTKYVDNILSYQPNRRKIIGCHNFYPHRYTGLSRDHFLKTSRQFKDLGFRTAAFVNAPSAIYGPWAVSEGLCTIESHRDLPIETQAKDLFNTGFIDDVIIANMFASDEELVALSQVNRELLTLKIKPSVELTDVEEKILFHEPHFNRGDVSEYMIRSTQSRVKYKGETFELKNAKDMGIGDVILESSLYTRYAGECQIALKDMKNSGKSSVLASVVEHERYLLAEIKPWQHFAFVK